ncbi:MAG: L,D-transpeptidase family protein [Alphaproteobacteria bacterium]|nr:L,D-transpeptidase family protein [Alphaproteobacteria bacterium]
MPNKIEVSGNRLSFLGKEYRCAIGKNGIATDKKEGDGCTPTGTFALRECWFRMDRMESPRTKLPLKLIRPEDGWCDDVRSSEYNKHIKITGDRLQVTEGTPKPAALNLQPSFEHLWRDDHVYDLIVPLGYNDDPVVPGRGSAIFMHVAHGDYRGTEGCIALAKEDMLEVLKVCSVSTLITIEKSIE